MDETYKLELDRLIRNGEIEPTIIVGVNSNEKEVEDTGLNFRNFEYVKNLSTEPNLSQLYEKHYFFFTKEVINYIHKKYNLEIGNKVFYGCSNGAGFGFNLMCDSDNIFDYFFLFSISGADRSLINDLHETKSNVYISYGDKEPFPLIENIKIIEKELNDKNYHFYLNVFKGGHSRKSWEKEFFIALKRLNRN
ncbi:alpha/beta hydrolase [Myroides injenensis]|uniref:alpha/beta hydrolase n=1 Tax=Myroides injenensis TaxID=1183151 RepID=UPI001ED8F6D9|nr:alpha/beta hydrolase-fold protein [Myroides injenensis]